MRRVDVVLAALDGFDVGLLLLAAGLALVWPPLALIVTGGVLVLAAFLARWRAV